MQSTGALRPSRWQFCCSEGTSVSGTISTDRFCLTAASCGHAGLTHLDFCSRSSRRDEDISDEGAEALAGMTALQSLNLAGHKDITADGLAFLADCTALTSLDLSGQQSLLSSECITSPNSYDGCKLSAR